MSLKTSNLKRLLKSKKECLEWLGSVMKYIALSFLGGIIMENKLLIDCEWYNKDPKQYTLQDCIDAYNDRFFSVIKDGFVVRLRVEC